MAETHEPHCQSSGPGFLGRLARDRSGNTIALIAAAIFPLLGLVGGGIDMGRAYLASSRLQQACDAGVLAARKRLGTETVVTGTIPTNTAELGQRFFNLNFQDGAYATENRSFVMTLEDDYSISGVATVDVPTSIMTIFGFDKVPVSVDCGSVVSVAALDVMMVLDVTGSMRQTNAGDTQSRMETLKQTIRDFHAQLEGAKAPGSAIRYGFVPYATNVNVGHLLEDSWMVSDWTYQSREDTGKTLPAVNKVYWENWTYVSGTRTPWTMESTYTATYVAPTGADQFGYYRCENPAPAGTLSENDVLLSSDQYIQDDPRAVVFTEQYERTSNGRRYRQIVVGTQCEVQFEDNTNYVETFQKRRVVPEKNRIVWSYKPIDRDVSAWRSETSGCIEERTTEEITDYGNVDLTRALDLNIDLIPDSSNPDTQWRPRYPDMIYARSFNTAGNGSFTTKEVKSADDFAATGNWWFSDCPAKAQKLTEMDAGAVNAYLDTLTPFGATYHDIGMIWGARLLSPTGLYAAENADASGDPKTRHLVFLTDGQTEPYDLAYGAYGIEGLDQRRWDESSSLSLPKTIEARFGVACAEAKKRNITVWVIAFGTYVNQAMVDCAGNGRYFEASNAVELNDAFTKIAKSVGDLRLNK